MDESEGHSLTHNICSCNNLMVFVTDANVVVYKCTVVISYLYHTVYSKPSLKKLQQLKVISAVGTKWYELGIMLLDEDQLNIIRTESNGITRCCAEMFLLWLGSHSNATWEELIDALKAPEVELYSVAEMVKMHCTIG